MSPWTCHTYRNFMSPTRIIVFPTEFVYTLAHFTDTCQILLLTAEF